MKSNIPEQKLNEIELSLAQFLESFNENMPDNLSQVSEAQLIKFKEEHASFFRKGDTWSLDLHRKKVMDWLPRKTNKASGQDS
jgi:hypothetical protein